ncbi:MAG: hypothetical protein KDA38_00500 [Planctomycetales bacterium]|nr:hypothetical protein [Planctomycetales bacterium]
MKKSFVFSIVGLVGLAGAGSVHAQQPYSATQPSYFLPPYAASPARLPDTGYRVAAKNSTPVNSEPPAYEEPIGSGVEYSEPIVPDNSSYSASCPNGSCGNHAHSYDSYDGGYYGGWLGGFTNYDACNASVWFSADWLFMKRSNDFTNARNVINGPDARGPNDLNFDYEGGWRLRAGAAINCWSIEASYWEVTNFLTEDAGDLTAGVAFDDGIGGPWAGQNYIDGSTYFSPIWRAASSPLENEENEGLGPNVDFADDPPVYTSEYWSGVKVFDLFLKPRCYSNGCTGYRWGVGYTNIQWSELSRETLQGTFRATDIAGGVPNAGLEHAALVHPSYGGLTLQAGPANGFDDETGAGGEDTVSLFYQGTASNSLNGVQMMWDARIMARPRFLVDTYVKAGVYDNYARGSIEEFYTENTADDSIYGRHLTDETHCIAYSGSFGFGGSFALTNCLAMRAGYEVMYLSGLALSPEQIDGVIGNSYRVKTDGCALLHGGWLGLEAIY